MFKVSGGGKSSSVGWVMWSMVCEDWSTVDPKTVDFPGQGGHTPIKSKFPVFSLLFPCVFNLFPVSC